jgi:hypothetical protein
MIWICKADLAEDAVERVSELHGFARRETCGVGVDEGERVIDDSPWAAVALGYDTHGRDP